jgi:hypothetical protein
VKVDLGHLCSSLADRIHDDFGERSINGPATCTPVGD